MAEDIVVPTLGESITEASIGQWLKKTGESVAADEPLVELETDKVAVEINAPSAGSLSDILAKEGETVEVGAVIARFEAGEGPGRSSKGKDEDKISADKESEPADKKEVEAEAKSGRKAAEEPERKSGQASPAAERLMAEHGLRADQIAASGRDGRVTKADVLKAIEEGGKPTQPTASAGEAQADGAREERVPMSRLRKRIADRLKEAQNTAAMLTTFNEADMSAVIDARSRYRDLFEKKHGIRLGFMSFFVKASIQALREIPAVNAEIDGDDIVYKNYYHIGVAVSAPSGLVVPVLKDADRLSFAETEARISDFAERARESKLTLDELQNGTFTISNGGVFGSLMSTPILNPPQSGILGMHKIEERPVARDGEIVVRPMMYLALSYDHRIVDGREAVTFLVRLKECIEDPERLLLDL